MPVPDREPTPPAREASDALRLRPPGSAVIAEMLREHAATPPRTGVARFFGASPLGVEARPWYMGALGELEIARVLDQVGPEWHAIHAVPVGTKGSDIDHVVIGPGGVFTINSKNHDGGKVWVAGKALLVNGQRTKHLRNAEHEADRAAKLLTLAVGAPVSVTPIVAVVGAKDITVRERPDRVIILRASQLARWLRRRPQTLDASQVAQLVDRASDLATWGNQPLPVADLSAFDKLRADVVSAHRRRLAWAVVGLAALFPAAYAFLAVLPGLVSAFITR
ncbi:nuclease-related domain-containing protein [Microbacterium sp. zg-YB36]|uniref:nuclease-related domain-containing protein n=1 Tax=Microbacterium sp. zg-YB36 TaxID=2969407 RepID=UPI00214BB987|nr:nuclease-related domain-containing protein [Microbacterium sp. zg-YB36]MDL5351278.1 nuclease-related domain-containing protein [Microbacterium sp. zg-YB36]